MMRWAPAQATGTIGTPASIAITKEPFLKRLHAPVGTTRPLGIDQKRGSRLYVFNGLLDAGESGVAIASIDGHKIRQTERQAYDGNVE